MTGPTQPADDLRARIVEALLNRFPALDGFEDLDALGETLGSVVEPELDRLRDAMHSMVVDLHAAQFDGATSLPDRPLDTVWEWLLDLVRKDRARLSGGNTPADAEEQISRTLVRTDGFHTGHQNRQQTAAVLALVRGWGSAVTTPKPAAEAIERAALRMFRVHVYGTNPDQRYVDSARKQWDKVLEPSEREAWRQIARDVAADLAPAGAAVPAPADTEDTTGGAA